VACRLKLTRQSGERILPCHYSDNYLSLAPGDTQEIEIRFDEVDRGEGTPKLAVSGINVDEKELPIGAVPVVYDKATGRKIPQLAARFAAGAFSLHDLAAGAPWSLTLLDMRGRAVTVANGIGNGGTQHVSPPKLRSGVYVAVLKCDGLQHRSAVTIAR